MRRKINTEEWHSLHAPIGLDSVKAEGICVALAERTGGVVLPAIPMGVNTIKPFKGFPHSIDISGKPAAQVAEEFCTQLAGEGFRLVILFTGHSGSRQANPKAAFLPFLKTSHINPAKSPAENPAVIGKNRLACLNGRLPIHAAMTWRHGSSLHRGQAAKTSGQLTVACQGFRPLPFVLLAPINQHASHAY